MIYSNNDNENSIFFYGTKSEYGYMSNFYKCSFKTMINVSKDSPYYNLEIEFNCSEQYFIFCKCIIFDQTNYELLENILNETNPTKIKALGRQVNNYNDEIWKIKRLDIMFKAIELKFNQNPILRDKLIATYPKNLYEASPKDNIWGIGFGVKNALNVDRHRYGCNYLGVILERVRENFI